MSLAALNIDLGGINNQGTDGEDLAAIFAAQAHAQAIQDSKERQERQQRTKIFIISGSVVSSIVLILLFFYFTSKPR